MSLLFLEPLLALKVMSRYEAIWYTFPHTHTVTLCGVIICRLYSVDCDQFVNCLLLNVHCSLPRIHVKGGLTKLTKHISHCSGKYLWVFCLFVKYNILQEKLQGFGKSIRFAESFIISIITWL